jgi:hypothetical protein
MLFDVDPGHAPNLLPALSRAAATPQAPGPKPMRCSPDSMRMKATLPR